MSETQNNLSNENPLAGRSLDDLFSAARSEGNILASDETTRAVLDEVMTSNPTTLSYHTSLFMRLMQGMRLNLGTTIMTTIGIGAAAILAVSLLSPTSQPTVVKGSNVTTHQQRSERATKSSQDFTNQPEMRAPNAKPISPIPRPNLASIVRSPALNRDSGFMSPVNVEGIKPIVLTPEQAKQLGIELASDGEITYRFLTDDNHKLMTHTFLPNSGSKLSIGDTGMGRKLNLPSITVRMVTNPNGEKRFFHFESSNTFMIGHGVNLSGLFDSSAGGSMHTSLTVFNDPLDSGSHKHARKETNTVSAVYDNYPISHDSDFNAETEDVEDIETDAPGMPPTPPTPEIKRRKIIIEQTDSNANGAELKEVQKELGVAKNHKVKIEIKMSRTVDHSDSAMNQVMEALKITKAEVNKMLGAAVMSGVPDTAMITMLTKEVQSKIANIDHSSIDSLLANAMSNLTKNEPNIDKLIPVLVENRTNAGKPNALIFWYDPSPAFTKLLPQGTVNNVAQTTPTGALSELSVFPNPATNATTLKYTLGDTRNLTVTLYNLLGQKMLEAGKLANQPAGHGAMKIDLSTMQPGVYILVANTDKGEQLTERIVVTK